MAKLLNIDANPKTVKGQAHGYMTAILYLAPFSLSDVNLCPTAEIAGCWKTCLNVQGRGGIPNGNWIHSAGRVAFSVPNNAIQRARLARTRLFNEDQPAFMDQLTHELAAFVKRAERKGLVPCVRLNGTSDILWERTGDRDDFTVFANFPSVQFYDYTKLPARLRQPLPPNYHLSVSWSGKNGRYQHMAELAARETGAPLVGVRHGGWPDAGTHWSMSDLDDIATRAGCRQVVNGDEHDLRFLDPPHSLVVLKAKGLARRESNGFVLGSIAA